LIDRIQTERLFGTRIALGHLDDLLIFHSNPQAMETLGGVRSRQTTQDYLATNMDHWAKYGYGIWLLHEPDGRFVGRGGIRHVTVGGLDEIEIAYALLPEFWGRGLATEIAEEFVRISSRLGIKELVALTSRTNVASRRVMEKLNFEFEKELDHFATPSVLYRLRVGA
jgi:RimJ/RimL family protein N-acetyltransferase